MKKESIIAMCVGIGLGILVAMIVIRLQNPSTTSGSGELPTPSVNIKLDISPSSESLLTLSSPSDGFVTKSSPQKLNGKLKSNAILLIQSEDTQLVKELPAGEFSEEIELTKGINQISLTAVNDKESVSQRINIYFDENEE